MYKKLYSIALAIVVLASCSKDGETISPVSNKTTSTNNTQKTETVSTSGILKIEGNGSTQNIYVSESLANFLETKANGDSKKYAEGLAELGLSSAERLFPEAGRFESRTREAGLHRWYVVSKTETKAAMVEIEEIEIVEDETNIVPMGTVYNDPYLPMQNALIHDEYGLNAHSVWEQFDTPKNEVIVAVVDGGIDASHDDLDGVIMNESYNFVRNTSSMIADNHGTAMAGIIAARCNNGTGMAGVADAVKILGCQIFETDANGKTISKNTARAIKWAADHGAVICNNSWGYSYSSDEDAANGGIASSDKAAIDYFIKYAGMDENGKQEGPMAGGLVLFSAGNSGFSHGWPAEYDNVIAVGAFDSNGSRASISNHGSWVDLCTHVEYLSTLTEGYGYTTGTSASCAGVSGAAALIVSRLGGEGFTASTLKKMLLNGAQEMPSAEGIGKRCDALASINMK